MNSKNIFKTEQFSALWNASISEKLCIYNLMQYITSACTLWSVLKAFCPYTRVHTVVHIYTVLYTEGVCVCLVSPWLLRVQFCVNKIFDYETKHTSLKYLGINIACKQPTNRMRNCIGSFLFCLIFYLLSYLRTSQ